MNIFITGGSGFIGRPLIKMLEKKGHSLLILSRGSAADFPIKLGTKSRVFSGDLSAPESLQKALEEFSPEAAIHLAWEGLPDYGPAMSIKNLNQGLALTKLLGQAGCKKMIVAGSCFEYGPQKGKLSEKSPLLPMNAFSAAKKSLHLLGAEIAKETGMQFIWTRFFYVYGPGQRAASLIPSLIASMRAGKEPQVKNPLGGNDFIFVDDVARALVLLAEKNVEAPEATYNVGSGKITGVQEVIAAVYGSKPVKMKKKPEGFFADISKIKKGAGWKPETAFQEGIRKMIDYKA